MIFRKALGEANVLSMVERRTRFAVLIRNTDRKAGPMADTIINALAPLPLAARQSITFDRGFEFGTWRELGTGMGTESVRHRPRTGGGAMAHSATRRRRGRRARPRT